MKKFIKRRPVLSFILLISVVFICLLSFLFYWAFYDINRISKDELLIESVSPDGSYTVNVYSSNGGATVPYGIVGELVFNKSDKKNKTIYWDLEEDASVEWLDNNIVSINNKKLKLPNEKYDYRHK